jgi:hypothetical protein
MHLILITAIVINAIKNSRFYETLSSPMPIIEDNLNDGEVPWFPFEEPIPNNTKVVEDNTMPIVIEPRFMPTIETKHPIVGFDEIWNNGEVPWSE